MCAAAHAMAQEKSAFPLLARQDRLLPAQWWKTAQPIAALANLPCEIACLTRSTTTPAGR